MQGVWWEVRQVLGVSGCLWRWDRLGSGWGQRLGIGVVLVYLGWIVVFVALLGSFPSARPCRYDRLHSPSSERTVYAAGECPSHLANGQCSTVIRP